MRSRVLLGALALVVPAFATAQPVYYVATNGSDTTGTGSLGSPWATIEKAVNMIPDGALVLVRPGTYNGRVRLDGGSPGRVFPQGIVVRSEVAYQARLRHTGTVVICFYGKGITLEGFDIAHSTPTTAGLVIQIQDLRGAPGGGDAVSRITIRNNVIHDSRDNDLLKINYGASEVTVEGNLFYNQSGSDEHIDINSVDHRQHRDRPRPLQPAPQVRPLVRRGCSRLRGHERGRRAHDLRKHLRPRRGLAPLGGAATTV